MVLPVLLAFATAAPAWRDAYAGDRCVAVRDRRVCFVGPFGRSAPLVVYLHGYGGIGSDDTLGLERLAAEAVSTLQIHGERDENLSPQGGVGRRTGARYLSARTSAAIAAQAAGCPPTATGTGSEGRAAEGSLSRTQDESRPGVPRRMVAQSAGLASYDTYIS